MPETTNAPEGTEGEIKDPLPEKLEKAVVSDSRPWSLKIMLTAIILVHAPNP